MLNQSNLLRVAERFIAVLEPDEPQGQDLQLEAVFGGRTPDDLEPHTVVLVSVETADIVVRTVEKFEESGTLVQLEAVVDEFTKFVVGK